METLNMIRLVVGSIFICLGLFVFLTEIIGVYKLKYILNRMHFAGAGDTAALAFTILGAIIINGFDYASAKLVLVLLFFWFTSPVSSHLISRLVMSIDETVTDHVKICDEKESEKYINQK